MIVPTRKYCKNLLEDFETPERIVAHCKKVSIVGAYLAARMNQHNAQVEVGLVAKLCWVHDAFKHWNLQGLYPGLHETQLACSRS